MEVGLALEFAAAAARLLLVEQALIQVCVDRHLFAGQRIEHEARSDLGDAARAFRNHDEVDRDEDDEQDDADYEVAADRDVREGFDHMAGRLGPVRAFAEDEPRAGDVQAEAQQRHHQQQRREHGEVERPLRVEREQQDQHRDREREREHEIQQERRQRHHQQAEDPEQRGAERDLVLTQKGRH